MSTDGAIEAVCKSRMSPASDFSVSDDPIRNLSHKRKRIVDLDLFGPPVPAPPPGQKYRPCVTGNALFDAVSLFDPSLDNVCEHNNSVPRAGKCTRTAEPVAKIRSPGGFQPRAERDSGGFQPSVRSKAPSPRKDQPNPRSVPKPSKDQPSAMSTSKVDD